MIFEGIAKKTISIGLCCVLYLLFSLGVYKVTHVFMHIMMAWNLFLAFLPLLWAIMIQKSLAKSNKLLCFVFSVSWLFFFPNAPYMVTDLIHLNGIKFYPPYYSTDIGAWLRLVHIGSGVFLGILTGFLSLYLIHQMLIRMKGRIKAGFALVSVCLLSGYGIYIGRFLRFNSWDIARPISLITRLIKDINSFSLEFSLLFAGYIFVTYIVFYVFFHKELQSFNIS